MYVCEYVYSMYIGRNVCKCIHVYVNIYMGGGGGGMSC